MAEALTVLQVAYVTPRSAKEISGAEILMKVACPSLGGETAVLCLTFESAKELDDLVAAIERCRETMTPDKLHPAMKLPTSDVPN